jgi:hypothetical protein
MFSSNLSAAYRHPQGTATHRLIRDQVTVAMLSASDLRHLCAKPTGARGGWDGLALVLRHRGTRQKASLGNDSRLARRGHGQRCCSRLSDLGWVASHNLRNSYNMSTRQMIVDTTAVATQKDAQRDDRKEGPKEERGRSNKSVNEVGLTTIRSHHSQSGDSHPRRLTATKPRPARCPIEMPNESPQDPKGPPLPPKTEIEPKQGHIEDRQGQRSDEETIEKVGAQPLR